MKNQSLYFIFNKKLIDKSKTIEQNDINDGDDIYVIIAQHNDKTNNSNIINLNGLIKIIFKACNQSFEYSFEIKKTEIFSEIENELYQKESSLRNQNLLFLANGLKIDTSKTIEQNSIKNEDVILVFNSDLDEKIENNENNQFISIKIKSNDEKFIYIFRFKKSDKMDKLIKELLLKYPELNKKKYYLNLGGNKIDSSKTVEENKIKDNDTLIIYEEEEFDLGDSIFSQNIDDDKISVKIISLDEKSKYDFECKKSDKIIV